MLIFFGLAILLMPIELKESFDIEIPDDINVINDMRAFSALTLVIGIFSIMGAFKRKFTYAAILIVFIQFLALGCGRLVSVVLDGTPIQGNIIGMSTEFFLGIVGAILFVKYRKNSVKDIQNA